MKAGHLRKLCVSLPHVTEQIQWEQTRVFKIGGKMFAASGTESDSKYSFKVDDNRFLELTDLAGVVPAPYLARAKWVQVDPENCQLSQTEIAALVKNSYQLVFAKLTKKLQRELRGTE